MRHIVFLCTVLLQTYVLLDLRFTMLSYSLDAATSSGILKAKQKLGVTFNSDQLGGIDLKKFQN